MPAVRIYIKHGEVRLTPAAIGDAGILTNDDLVSVFGNDRALVIISKDINLGDLLQIWLSLRK